MGAFLSLTTVRVPISSDDSGSYTILLFSSSASVLSPYDGFVVISIALIQFSSSLSSSDSLSDVDEFILASSISSDFLISSSTIDFTFVSSSDGSLSSSSNILSCSEKIIDDDGTVNLTVIS